MDKQKILFNVYFYFIILIGGLIFLVSLTNIKAELLYLYFLWIVLFVAIEMRPVSLDVKGQISLGFALNLAILMIYGTWASVIVTGIGSAVADIIGKRGWQKTAFNISQYSISLFMAGYVYSALNPISKSFTTSQHVIPFVFTAITFVVFNYLLVAIIVSLSFKIPLIDVIKMDLGMVLLFLTSLAPMSLLMVILYTNEPWSIVLILPPLVLAYKGFENYLKLRKQTRATIELLADAIDRRDPYTASHSLRVSIYAEKIAQELGLSYDLIENIVMAGRVHDLGKIGVSDNILLKPEALSSLEYAEMKKHSEIGYDILAPLEIYNDLVTFVLHHHERLDGTGYPSGIKNNSIPLGARILAVADSYDAMTGDRPYRKAMSQNQAINELIKNQSTQFDPQVVKALIKVLEKEKIETNDKEFSSCSS